MKVAHNGGVMGKHEIVDRRCLHCGEYFAGTRSRKYCDYCRRGPSYRDKRTKEREGANVCGWEQDFYTAKCIRSFFMDNGACAFKFGKTYQWRFATEEERANCQCEYVFVTSELPGNHYLPITDVVLHFDRKENQFNDLQFSLSGMGITPEMDEN